MKITEQSHILRFEKQILNKNGVLCGAKLLQSCLTLCDPMDCQAPRPWDSPGKNNWSRLPSSPPGALPNPGIKPVSPKSPALAGGFFYPKPPGKPFIQEHQTLIATGTESFGG